MQAIDKLPSTLQFSAKLPADSDLENRSRQVENACFSFVDPKIPRNPEWVHLSSCFLEELNLSVANKDNLLKKLSGSASFDGCKPYAMCYGGHQFGHWAGQLGDGRAINVAELLIKGQNLKFQLKGAGPTPYSRGADGFAVMRSSIREYLCSEAMHHLGIATTRALSLVKTGDKVMRDIFYDGNRKAENGAIVCRVAPSFIRFGSFELPASRGDLSTLKTLVDYTIKEHYTHLGLPSKEGYVRFFEEIADRTKKMILNWQRVGFVHGVMNTDNLSILGLTIDYGPYGWLENYDKDWTPNTSDAQNKRYRFGAQPQISLWNLTQLANALYPLVGEAEPFEKVLKSYHYSFQVAYMEMMRTKLGLKLEHDSDRSLIKELEDLMQKSNMDMTIFFRKLADFENSESFLSIVRNSSYLLEEQLLAFIDQWKNWLSKYEQRLALEVLEKQKRKAWMNSVNPKYIFRNYMAQLAIEGAENGDYKLVDEFYTLLKKPYDDQPEMEKWFSKRPDWATNKVGCSMLSCSS